MQNLVTEQTVMRGTNGRHWQVYHRKPDGTFFAHAFPLHTLDARAVEYDVDIAERDVLWDMVIHEPFMVEPSDELAVATFGDPAENLAIRARGRARSIVVPNTCHTAPNAARALAAHQARVLHCKNEIAVVEDPKVRRDPILRHPIDREFVARYRDEHQKLREATRGAIARFAAGIG